MSEWVEMELGQFLELKRGYDLPKKSREQGSVPLISSSGESDVHNEAKVKGPGVVTGRYGTIGQVFFVKSDFWPLNTTLYVKDFKSNNPLFVYYFLKTISYGDYSDKAAVPGVNRNHLHNARVKVPLDPMCQRDIAEKLWALDKKIELNRQINQTLEQIAQALFKSWFVDFDPTRAKIAAKQAGEDPERAAMAAISGKPLDALDQLDPTQLAELQATAALFPDALMESELGGVPEAWEVKTLDEVTSMIIDHRGKTPKKLGGDWEEIGYPAISAKNIKNGRITRHDTIRFVSSQLYSKWMKVEIEKGDILLTSEAPMGELFFVADEKKFCLSQRLYGIRADNKHVTPCFLYAWLQSPAGQSDLEGRATGTTVVGIRQAELRKVKVLVPSFDTLAAFEKNTWPLREKINVIEHESKCLEELRDGLLPKLLGGYFEVGDR